jgi:hypothetical protein
MRQLPKVQSTIPDARRLGTGGGIATAMVTGY